MKKFLFYFKWVLIVGCVTSLITVASFVYYLENSIDKVMDKKEQVRMFTAIDTTKTLPDEFYFTIRKYYPDYFNQSVWASVGNQLIGDYSGRCQCRSIYLYPWQIKRWSIFSSLIVALELEDRFSQKRCYEYIMFTSDFGYNTRGVEEAAKLYYNKSLNELNEREILELNLIQKAPTFYSPILNPKRLDEEVNNIMNR